MDVEMGGYVAVAFKGFHDVFRWRLSFSLIFD